MENILGVIGGMGPMATQLFYKMLIEKTKAEKDQDHINVMILADAGMPDRTTAILSGHVNEIYDRMLDHGRFLEKNGCKAIAITCNTSHYIVDIIEKELSIPIIHMIRETAKETAVLCPGGKIAVLATDGTIQMGLYQKELEAKGMVPYVPSEEGQKLVMYQIYDRIKTGLPADMEAWTVLEKELKAAGCDRALLACTELSVIKEDNKLDDFYIDPMEVLAKRSIEFRGKELR